MHLSALDAIDDPQQLRAMLVSLRAQLDARDRLIDARERTIKLRDTQIAALTPRLRGSYIIARSLQLNWQISTAVFHSAQRRARSSGSGTFVNNRSISARLAMRTGAARPIFE
jgi:hypothetical protein